MKLGILFNCQNKGLANAFRALFPEWEVINFDLGFLCTEETQQNAATQLRSCDRVVSIPMSSDFGPLASEVLKKECALHVLPGVSFFGFHPDTIYITGPQGNFSAATGHYHSRIAVAAYLAGLSVEEAEALYNALVYEKLGYFDAYNQSSAFLVKTFKPFSVDISHWLDKWRASGCFMHTINHPKIHVICDLALIASSIMGIDTKCNDDRLQAVPDNLLAHPEMPLYPEIARRIGNGLRGHTLFKPINDLSFSNFKLLTLPQYLRSCFNSYANAPKDMLLKGRGVDNALHIISSS